jgi:UDP-N-acetylmuramoyl-L-alanyl-D-glutamate--2,6-diaminopimelate ligase
VTLPPPLPRAMALDDLLGETGIVVDAPVAGIAVRGICDDSRAIVAGDLFIALRGTRTDGRRHVVDALARGAVAVLAEEPIDVADAAVPVLVVPDLRARAGELASAFYGHPSRAMRVVAVTGTNGKTTCSWLVAAALARLGERAAVIGTLGVGQPPHCEPLVNTTPGAVELQRLLARLRDAGCTAVAMEASSIGLDQQRLNGVAIDVAVFTNLSHDHLDYHGDMQAYAAAKARLFAWPGLRAAVLNTDDACARAWLREGAVHAPRVLTYGLAGTDLRLLACAATEEGALAQIQLATGVQAVPMRLVGDFNAANLMAVGGVLLALGHAPEQLAIALADLDGPPGRMERIGGVGEPRCIVDYAHTPDALEKVLDELDRARRGDLWCVFGCGGDRDRAKRPRMGEVAARLATQVVVTSDNPRSESPQAIVDDILAGIARRDGVTVLLDRAAAIAHAVRAARDEDTVLVAGKGHEQYQEAGGVRQPFSDQAQVRAALAARRAGAPC